MQACAVETYSLSKALPLLSHLFTRTNFIHEKLKEREPGTKPWSPIVHCTALAMPSELCLLR